MKLNSLEDTFNLSKKIGKLLSNGDVILLYGEIGVGKTTFVRGLINNLEIEKNSKIIIQWRCNFSLWRNWSWKNNFCKGFN